jgi:magnesium transporter
MIRIFYLNKNGGLTLEKKPRVLLPADCDRMIWVDLQSSSEEEQRLVQSTFQIEFYTPQEAAEIESSSRYFEDDQNIEANNAFIIEKDKGYFTEQVSFILKKEILYTLRNADIRAFGQTVRRLKTFRQGTALKGLQIFLSILEAQIDHEADVIEYISKLTNTISKKLIQEKSYREELLISITELQENTILARECIVDKQRLVSSMLKSDEIGSADKERLRIIIKDINSILQHVEFSFERLEFLQNTFLGLVNIEQNTVIKIFTVVTVVFMPPTLIASIYGMNFSFMPELSWPWGYPVAILLMVISSLSFLWYFKKKKWL